MMQPLMRFSAKARLNRRVVLAALAGLTLGACTAAQPGYQPKKVVFADQPVWRMAADEILVENGPDVTSPDSAVSVRIAEPPVAILKRWVAMRLSPDSASRGSVTVTIERAEASEKYVPKPKGVTAAFTDNIEAELTVAFAVVITAKDPSGQKTGEVRADASIISNRLESVDEDAKRRQWERILQDVATRLDAELNKRIPNGLAPFLQQR